MTYEEALEYAKGYMTVEGVPISAHEATACIVEALEKQVPKKPLEVASPVLKWGLCSACHGELNKLANQPNRVFAFHRFCPDCGQALLWEDTE